MNFVKIFLAVLVGFFPGAMLFHAPFYTATVNAQSKMTINVTRANVGPGNVRALDVPSGQIVGFSCANDDCFIATRLL
jgi:hypothetical protein